MPAQSFAPTILLTRPDAQSARFASQLHHVFPNVAIVISPILQAAYFSPPLPAGRFAAVIFTSQAAVEAAKRFDRAALPRLAYCVGVATQTAAERAGFETRATMGDSLDLISLIATDAPTEPLLYLRGVDVTGDIAASLNDRGVNTQSLVVYQQVEQALNAEAMAVLSGGSPVILPVFSRRSASLLCKKMSALSRHCPIWGAALSPAIAQEMIAFGCERMVIADYPSSDALISAITPLIAKSVA